MKSSVFHRCTATSGVKELPYLQGLQLAHPITTDRDFCISLLIGVDHYWDIMKDHIIRGMTQPLLVQRLDTYFQDQFHTNTHSFNVLTSTLHISTQHNKNDHGLQRFLDLETTGREHLRK